MRKESLFSWQHPLIELNGISMCLFNIRAWNGYLKHFLLDKIYSTNSSLFCFTETNYMMSCKTYWWNPGWFEDIHENTQHDLALCYNMSKVNIIEVIAKSSILEELPIVQERKRYFLLVVYCMPGPLGSFIDCFILLINELPTQQRILIVGDFNLDQMLPEYVAKVDPLIQYFNLSHHA